MAQKYNVNVNFATAASAALGAAAVAATPQTNAPSTIYSSAVAQGAHAMTTNNAAQASAPSVSVDLLDAKLEAVEARTETKFAQLIGKLDLLVNNITDLKADVGTVQEAVERVESKTNNTRMIIFTTVIGASLTIVGLTYGIIGYGHQVADTVAAAFANGQAVKK